MWGRELKEDKCLGYLKRLTPFRNKHIGESCVIMGSGPSLKDIPVDFLKRFKVFAVNGSCRYYHPDYMVTGDSTFPGFDDIRKKCNEINTPFFINWWWSDHKAQENILKDYSNEISIPTYECDADYTDNNVKLINHIIRCYNYPSVWEQYGSSVLCSGVPEVAIPLAVYMGFEKIYLAGVDFTKDVTVNNHHFDNKKEEYDNVSWGRWKLLDGNKYGSGSLWDIKRFSLEIISESFIRNKVFNLSETSTIESIKKINYLDIIF